MYLQFNKVSTRRASVRTRVDQQRLKLICPVQPHFKKYFRFLQTQIISLSLAIPSRLRGVSRSSRTLGWDAVDAAASSREGIAGRVSREHSTGAWTNGAARGRQSRVVLAPVAGVKSAEFCPALPGPAKHQSSDDGDKTNSSPGRARNKP
jgi:hypothetical protein